MLVNSRIRSKVNFGYNVYADLGASNSNGTIKLCIKSDNGEILFSPDDMDKYKDKIDKVVCPEGINTKEDYIKGIGRRIAQAVDICSGKIKNLGEKLSGILVLIPGTVLKGNRVPYISNIKCKEKNTRGEYSLEDVGISKENLQKCKKFDEIAKDADYDYKLMAFNDVTGAVVSTAKYVEQKKPELFDEGARSVVIIVGGGCGFTAMEAYRNDILFRTYQIGHMPINLPLPPDKEKFGPIKTYHDGVSVSGLVTNYLKALDRDINDAKCQELIKIGNAKVVTNYQLKVNKKSPDYSKLLGTGLFKEEPYKKDSEQNEVILTRTDINEEQHKAAARMAVDTFVFTLAKLCGEEAGRSAKAVFLTGPFINGLDEFVKKDSAGEDSLTKLVERYAYKNVSIPVNDLMKSTNFSINIIPEINSNIEDADLILNNAELINREVNNYISIPRDAFKLKS